MPRGPFRDAFVLDFIEQGMGLPRAGLPVGNDAGIEALCDVFDGTLSDDVVDEGIVLVVDDGVKVPGL